MAERGVIRLITRYRVRGLEAGELVVDAFHGAVVGTEFRGRGPAGLVRCHRTEVSSSVEKAVGRYVRLESTSKMIRSWVEIDGGDCVVVRP